MSVNQLVTGLEFGGGAHGQMELVLAFSRADRVERFVIFWLATIVLMRALLKYFLWLITLLILLSQGRKSSRQEGACLIIRRSALA